MPSFNLKQWSFVIAVLTAIFGSGWYFFGDRQNVLLPDIPQINLPNIGKSEPLSNESNESKELKLDIKNIERFFSNYDNSRMPYGSRVVYICSGYGCVHTKRFLFNNEFLNELKYNFYGVKDADHERKIIALTIAQIEKKVGEHLGGEDRAGESFRDNASPTQMNRSDEALNTVSYLIILMRNNLLRYHSVLAPKWLDNVPYAVIEDAETNEKFGINSFMYKNGEVPIIIRLP